MRALISCGVYFLPSMSSVVQPVPMWRLTERIVRSGLVMAWRLATSPTRTSPFLAKATTDGVVRPPSALGMTVGLAGLEDATTELVVPRSMPTALAMWGPHRVRERMGAATSLSALVLRSHREVECLRCQLRRRAVPAARSTSRAGQRPAPNRKPWPAVQPPALEGPELAAASMPSATTSRPRLRPRAMIASTTGAVVARRAIGRRRSGRSSPRRRAGSCRRPSDE